MPRLIVVRRKTVRRPGAVFCWRRWIIPGNEDLWIERLEKVEGSSWSFAEKPGRKRLLLEDYVGSGAATKALCHAFGGEVRTLDAGAWIKPHSSVPTRIGGKLEIVHGPMRKARGTGKAVCPRLHIPHGVAFGSGEHATTSMLLRALVREGNLSRTAVLDLGTGSGILALAARLLGARKILATDFDPDAVRTAAQNEALNFSDARIRWQCADVKRLKARARYGLVLANLFSGILVEAAPQICASVAPGERLWLSGILRSQKDEVIAAYRAEKMRLERSNTRGKWVLLQFRCKT